MNTEKVSASVELEMWEIMTFTDSLHQQGHVNIRFLGVEGCTNIVTVNSSLPAENSKSIDKIFLLGKTENGQLHSREIASSVDTEEKVEVLRAKVEEDSLVVYLIRKSADSEVPPRDPIWPETALIFLGVPKHERKVETLRLPKVF